MLQALSAEALAAQHLLGDVQPQAAPMPIRDQESSLEAGLRKQRSARHMYSSTIAGVHWHALLLLHACPSPDPHPLQHLV